jgi:hypothetical protein
MVVVHPSVWSGNPEEDLLSYEIAISTRMEGMEDWESAFSVIHTRDEAYNILTFLQPREFRYARLEVVAPSKGESRTARVVEWEIWGTPLASLPIRPTPRSDIAWPEEPIEDNLSVVGYMDWERMRDFAQSVMDDPTIDEYTRSRAMLEYGFALFKVGGDADPYEVLERVKRESAVPEHAAQAAVRMADAMLTANDVEGVYERLVWAMGMFPGSPSAIWARVNLIDYHRRVGNHDQAWIVGQELFRLFDEGRVSLGQLAWAELKLAAATHGGRDGPLSAEQLGQLESLWVKYQDGVSGLLGDENETAFKPITRDDPSVVSATQDDGEVIQDVAFRAKFRKMMHHYNVKGYTTAVNEGEELLSRFPDKWAWSPQARFFIADSHYRLRNYTEARNSITILKRDFPDDVQTRGAERVLDVIAAWERHYYQLLSRFEGGRK